MQVVDSKNEFNGAFLSWMNEWHAWGNSQSYALLKSYELLKDEKILSAALYELDNFYEYLISSGHLNSFTIKKENENFSVIDKKKFSQIAYNIRPMVYALMEAYKITGDEKYAVKAGKAAQWFLGSNYASAIMYNADTGIIFDGINSETDVNKNSGAESTIEALLSLLEISQNETALKYLLNK